MTDYRPPGPYYFVCHTCAADPDHEPPHEVLTASDHLASLFRMSHAGHNVSFARYYAEP